MKNLIWKRVLEGIIQYKSEDDVVKLFTAQPRLFDLVQKGIHDYIYQRQIIPDNEDDMIFTEATQIHEQWDLNLEPEYHQLISKFFKITLKIDKYERELVIEKSNWQKKLDYHLRNGLKLAIKKFKEDTDLYKKLKFEINNFEQTTKLDPYYIRNKKLELNIKKFRLVEEELNKLQY